MPQVLTGVAAFLNCTKLIERRHFCFIKQHQSIALDLDCTLQTFTVKIHARDYYNKSIFEVPMYYVKSVSAVYTTKYHTSKDGNFAS